MRFNTFNLIRGASKALLLLACIGAAWGQDATTSLRGEVKDNQGGVVPGAIVELVRTDTGLRRNITTDAGGEYQFAQMPPGTYTVTVQKPGFSILTQRGVQLQVNTPALLNMTLEVASVAESVNVEAETPAINVDNAAIGIGFNQNQVRQLPLQTRNVVELLSLQPGVTPTGEVLGARRDQNNITLDGVDVNDEEDAGIAGSVVDTQGSNANGASADAGFASVLPIPLDSVQEFRVTVGGEGAAEGRSSGGQVALITKSGSNQLHGSAYEYNRNTITSANTFFNNASDVPRQPLVRNQFGASLGGAIKKDRAFYFLNYERRLDASGVSQIRYVPSQSLKEGIINVQTTDGAVYSLSPQAIQAIDPLHVGNNAQMLAILNQYPVANDPSVGADGGLNFSGYRFNAPDHRDDRAYVGKMDFILDSAAKQTLSIRGTLSNSTRDRDTVLTTTQYGVGTTGLAQFPGQASASQILDNSKGLAVQYTIVLKPNLVNVARYGFTRQGVQTTGVPGVSLSDDNLSQLYNYNARAQTRILPVTNAIDDLTWIHGKHTITTGINFRFVRNNRTSYANSFANYGYSVGSAVGLGEDIDNDIQTYLAAKTGNPNIALAAPSTDASAFGEVLGLINNTTITYQFAKDGSVLPQGAPAIRNFAINGYDTYVGDTWRATKELTINYGLHYSNERPPYETKGLQVASTQPLQDWWDQREYLASIGVPGNAVPNPRLTYALDGPANGKPSWYGPDNLDFSPRLGIAYAPQNPSGLEEKIFGKNGVFRVGASIVYDHFGSSLITQYDSFGSQGLSTQLNNLESYTFSNSPRYDGTAPAEPAPPTGGFPYTPADIHAIAGSYYGIASDLKAPYSYVFNATFARQLPGKLTMEVGYIGRLGHRLLLQGDIFTALENFKDPISGETWKQGMTTLRQDFDGLASQTSAGLSVNPSLIASEVMNNPSLIAADPFIQSMFGGLKNYFFNGSASANYFYAIYGVYNGSYLDTLHTMDRLVNFYGNTPGTCMSRTGCFTFFAPQGSGDPTWMNAGESQFNGATLTFRRTFSTGFSFDFNYTLSHSIDNGSTAESGAGYQGASIQNIYDQEQFRGDSDFDIRHNITANFLYELPVGKGKPLFGNPPGWLNQIIGGWQLSSIIRYHSGLPSIIQGTYAWNTNYDENSIAIPVAPFQEHQGIDAQGNPSLFSSTALANNFVDQWPGSTGERAIVRLAGAFNEDVALSKQFNLPWEGHHLQLRGEAFNVLNNVSFIQPSLALYSPTTFGEYQNTTPPRVMQFALRYEF